MTRARDVSNIDGLLTTKGDIYAATGAGVVVRQGVGSDGQVLTADSAEADGLKWATVSSGWTQISTGSISGSTFTIGSIPSTYRDLRLVLLNPEYTSTNENYLGIRINGVSDTGYYTQRMSYGSSAVSGANDSRSEITYVRPTNTNAMTVVTFPEYSRTGCFKFWNSQNNASRGMFWGFHDSITAAISSITFLSVYTETLDGGTYILYGAN